MQSRKRAQPKARLLIDGDFRNVAKNSSSRSLKYSSCFGKAVKSKASAEINSEKNNNSIKENNKKQLMKYLGLSKKSVCAKDSGNKCLKRRKHVDVNGNITECGNMNKTINCLRKKALKWSRARKLPIVSFKSETSPVNDLSQKLLKINFEDLVPTFIIVFAKNCEANDIASDSNDQTSTTLENTLGSGSGSYSCDPVATTADNSQETDQTVDEADKNENESGIKSNFTKTNEVPAKDETLQSAIKEKYKFESDLMPWLGLARRKNFKEETSYEIMKSKQSLMDLYKCMDSNCAYTTKFRLFFISHINDHQRQGSLLNFFNLCAYCPFVCSNPDILALHIHKAHSFSKFQCSMCFFRTPEKETAHEHLILHHKEERGVVYRCPGNETRSREEMQRRILEMRARFVKPIPCKHCQVPYYSLRALTTHLVFDHDDCEVFQHVPEDDANTKCLFQCIYCSHGETNLRDMSRHMIEHPTEIRYCCVRDSSDVIQKNNVLPTSISLTSFERIQFGFDVNIEDYSTVQKISKIS